MMRILAFLALLALPLGAQTDPYSQLPAYDFGKDAAPVAAITKEVFDAKLADYPGIEGKLLAVLAKPEATYAAKKFVCEQLRIVGSESSVNPLLKCLDDDQLAPQARFALDTLPGSGVDEALLKLLPKAGGNRQIALIQTLAARRCEKAVGALKPMIGTADAGLATAALGALGRISGPEAMSVLKSAKVSAELEPVRQRAWIDGAFVLADSADFRNGAVLAFEEEFKKGTSLPAVIAALNGIVAVGDKALPTVMEALRDSREDLALAAAQAAVRISGPAVTGELTKALPGLPPAVQVAVVETLAQRRDPAAMTSVKALLNSPVEAVKAESALALEVLGDASVVPELIALSTSTGDVATAAQQSLGRINAPGVNESMAKMLDDADAKKVRVAALTLRARADASVLPRLVSMAGSAKADVRNAALEALDGFAGTAELPALLGLLDTTKSPDKVVSVIWKATTAIGKEEERFVSLWGDGSRHPVALISLASVAGGVKPLEIAIKGAASSDPALKEAAARSLFAWKTDAAIAPIQEIVQTNPEAKMKILGTRAIVRLVTDRKCNWKQPKKIGTLQQLQPLLSRPEDKKMVEDAIAKIQSGKN